MHPILRMLHWEILCVESFVPCCEMSKALAFQMYINQKEN
jgi:hypothetical protein